MDRRRLCPVAQWFHESGMKAEFEKHGNFVGKDDLHVVGGRVFAYTHDRKIELPLGHRQVVQIPHHLVPTQHHTWVSASEFTSRLVWYVGHIDAVTCVLIRMDAIKRSLGSYVEEENLPPLEDLPKVLDSLA